MKWLMFVLLAGLLMGCATTPFDAGMADGMRTAGWVAGAPLFSMHFDRAQYMADAGYRQGFDEGLHYRVFPIYRNVADQARILLRLDELTAQAEAREASTPTP